MSSPTAAGEPLQMNCFLGGGRPIAVEPSGQDSQECPPHPTPGQVDAPVWSPRSGVCLDLRAPPPPGATPPLRPLGS